MHDTYMNRSAQFWSQVNYIAVARLCKSFSMTISFKSQNDGRWSLQSLGIVTRFVQAGNGAHLHSPVATLHLFIVQWLQSSQFTLSQGFGAGVGLGAGCGVAFGVGMGAGCGVAFGLGLGIGGIVVGLCIGNGLGCFVGSIWNLRRILRWISAYITVGLLEGHCDGW